MKTTTVAFDIICPNSRTRNMLEFAIKQNGKGCFVNSKGKPDLVIVDCETTDTLNEFRRFRQRNAMCPAVLLFSQLQDAEEASDVLGDNVTYLVRPFSVKDLMQTLDHLPQTMSPPNRPAPVQPDSPGRKPPSAPDTSRTKLSTENGAVTGSPPRGEVKADQVLPPDPVEDYVQNGPTIALPAKGRNADGDIPDCPALKTSLPLERYMATFGPRSGDIDLGDATALRGIQINARNNLLGRFTDMIAKAAPDPKAICLTLNGKNRIFFDPATRLVARSGDPIEIADIAQLEFSDSQVAIEREVFPDSTAASSCELEPFLWKLALYTYRGLLPEATSVQEPVYLRYWPNLTRLEPVPNAMRIASLWCRQPVSLASLIGMLKIPQKQVFVFYVGACAIGLAGPATRQADGMLTASLPSMGVRSHTIIQQLADKLIRKNSAAQ